MTKKLCFFIIFLSCSLVSLVDASIRVTVSKPTGNQNSGESSSSSYSSYISYKVVNEFNDTLFRGDDLAVFMYGTWCVASSSSSSSSAQQQSSSSTWSTRSNNNDSTKTSKTQKTETSSRPLTIVNQETVNGTISGLGKYHGVRIRWTCSPIIQSSDNRNKFNNNNDPSTDTLYTPISVPVVTSFLNLESQRAVVFDIEFPNGAENTSLTLLRNNDNDDGSTATLATFPSFVMASSTEEGGGERKEGIPIKSKNKKIVMETNERNKYFPPTFPSALSWAGSFVQSVRGLSTGPQGGPTVFYNASDPFLKNVVMASQFFFSKTTNNPYHSLNKIRQHRNTKKSNTKNHWSTFTAGNNKDWTGRNSAFSPGISGRIKSMPPGFSQSILLYEGSQGGITATLDEWGSIMQKSSISLSSRGEEEKEINKIKDVTLGKIGYQTDNGAMYCFCRQSNCSEVLLHEKEYLDSIGIPIGYLSFQGAGTSSGRGKAAPWCIERWSADGGQDPEQYPLDMKTFHQALAKPLQLYAPYFCPNSTKYFKPITPWKSVSSNPDLPGCSDFSFDTVDAADSKEFFTWFMKKGVDAAEMASFESDFMNQNVNCVDDFIESATATDDFLSGMADAALELNTPIQWCYASPNSVFASLDLPAVTNFRVSFDFCYGHSYEIGESSLLVWALGAAASKDTLWTTNNNKTETPGCKWTADHETVAAELHIVLALMSTGPVGISDAIGMTNATLLQRVISKDGSLLQPSKPITAVDSSFLDNSQLDGYLYGTFSLGPSWIFVSFQIRNPFTVTLRDFWPPLKVENSFSFPTLLAYRTFASSSDCLDGADAIQSGCVTMVAIKDDVSVNSSDSIFVVPSSSFESPGSDLSPAVVTVFQECPHNGVFFLGELNKYVSLSPKRFKLLTCTKEGISVMIQGSKDEIVELTFLLPRTIGTKIWYEVSKEKVKISYKDTLVRVDFRMTDHPNRETIFATREE